MFKLENNHVILTEDSRYGKVGEDLGHLADVCLNHLAAIDPAAPADSLVYRVLRACCDEHAAELEARDQAHAAEIKRLANPQPDDEKSIEAAAQRLASKKRAERRIEQRAAAILAKEEAPQKGAK